MHNLMLQCHTKVTELQLSCITGAIPSSRTVQSSILSSEHDFGHPLEEPLELEATHREDTNVGVQTCMVGPTSNQDA